MPVHTGENLGVIKGTKKTNRRFKTEHAQYSSAKDLGLGLLHWQTHVQALQHIKAALNYRDATTSEWKLILDQWIAKDRAEGRGAIFTTDPEDFKHERKRLPTFWLGVMRAVLGKLKLELIEEETITTETATNMGWTANRNDTSMKKKKQVWADRLRLNRVGDILCGPMETYGH